MFRARAPESWVVDDPELGETIPAKSAVWLLVALVAVTDPEICMERKLELLDPVEKPDCVMANEIEDGVELVSVTEPN
jgi:hypothetical protein